MKQTDLADLKSLLKQYRKARTEIRQASKRHRTTEADLAELEEKRGAIFSRMIPYLKIIRKESAAFRDPVMKVSIRLFYYGIPAADIADTFETTEQYIQRTVRKAERILTESEKEP